MPTLTPNQWIALASAGIRLLSEIQTVAQKAREEGRDLTLQELDLVKLVRKEAMDGLADAIASRLNSDTSPGDSTD